MNQELIEQRKAGLDQFIAESHPVIVDFAERLEHPNASAVLTDNTEMSYLLGMIGEFMKDELVDEETHNWITARIGYTLGEYFIQKYNGYWEVNKNPESPQYGHYVIFAISPRNEQKAYPIDTFEAAHEYVSQEPERDLISLIEEIEGMLV